MALLCSLPCSMQAILATLMTYLFTALGAALVLVARRLRPDRLDSMLALGAGIMLASAFWSLLEPGISLADEIGQPSWLIASVGFLSGSAFLLLADRLFVPAAHAQAPNDPMRRTRLLIASITLHNIPEGLAVGVAFGALAVQPAATALRGAWLLALGIGIQNFPEGAAVSLPLLREGLSPGKAFHYGHLSGLVEPVAGLCGVLLAFSAQQLLPFLLCFAGGAMVLVVLSELVPESQRNPHPERMTVITLLGFVLMMVLDVAFG